MADPRLVSYIKTNIAKGADPRAIKMTLVRNGYSMQQVEEAFSENSQVHVHHTIAFTPTFIALIAAVLLSIGGFSYFLFSESSAPSQLLDVEIRSVTPNLNAGDEASIVVELTNMGAKNRYDVEVRAELVSASTGAIVAAHAETVALETKGSPTLNLLIPPQIASGNYILRTVAEYDGKRAVASMNVVLGTRQPSCNDGIKNQGEERIDCVGPCQACGSYEGAIPLPTEGSCDDFNPCTADSLTNGACTFMPITPCCGNSICETGEASSCQTDCPTQSDAPELSRSEQLERIKLMATSDPERAGVECRKESIPDYRDSCYSNIATTAKDISYCNFVAGERLKNVCIREVAQVTLNPTLCGSISREDFRDTCFISFVTEYRDYSVCENIVNENLRQSCLALRSLSQPAAVQTVEAPQETVYESPYV